MSSGLRQVPTSCWYPDTRSCSKCMAHFSPLPLCLLCFRSSVSLHSQLLRCQELSLFTFDLLTVLWGAAAGSNFQIFWKIQLQTLDHDLFAIFLVLKSFSSKQSARVSYKPINNVYSSTAAMYKILILPKPKVGFSGGAMVVSWGK